MTLDGGTGGNARSDVRVLLTNTVSGSAGGGDLVLGQLARAGDGGDSQGGNTGDAGDAKSVLIYDDAVQATRSGSVTLTSQAGGGTGGDQSVEGGRGGAGGDGTAIGSFTVTGKTVLQGTVTAFGGMGGDGGTEGLGGNALALGRATGGDVRLSVNANVFAVGGHSGLAQSIGAARGDTGDVQASASVIGTAGVSAIASATGAISMSLTGGGFAIVAAGGRAGGDMPSASATADSIVTVHTDLAATELRGIYAENGNIRSAFTGDLEAVTSSHFSSVHGQGGGLQTITSSLQVQIKPAQLDALGNTVIGIHDGEIVGSGFDTLHFEIVVGDADEVVLVSQDFTDAQTAQAFFHDHAFDLGFLGEYNDYFGNLFVKVRVTTTGSAHDGGFAGDILIADVGGSTKIGAYAGVADPHSADLARGSSMHVLDHPTAAMSEFLLV